VFQRYFCFIGNLCILHLILLGDIFSINGLPLILKIIGQCVTLIVIDKYNKVILKALTDKYCH
jgi:hypothetical protein